MGALDQFLCIPYWGPSSLSSLTSLTIWRPPEIICFCILYGVLSNQFLASYMGAPSDQFYRLLYMGAPLISFFTYYMGPPQISFCVYYMGTPQINSFAYYMGAISDQFLHILFGGPFKSVSLHTI